MKSSIATTSHGFVAAMDDLDGGKVLSHRVGAEILCKSAERHEALVVQVREEAARINNDNNLSASGKTAKLRALYAERMAGRAQIAIDPDMLAALRKERETAFQRVQEARTLPVEGDPILAELRAQEVRRVAWEQPEAQRVQFHAAGGPEIQRALESGPIPLLPEEYLERTQATRAKAAAPAAVDQLKRLDALLNGLEEHERRFPQALASACGLPLSHADDFLRAQEAARRRGVA